MGGPVSGGPGEAGGDAGGIAGRSPGGAPDGEGDGDDGGEAGGGGADAGGGATGGATGGAAGGAGAGGVGRAGAGDGGPAIAEAGRTPDGRLGDLADRVLAEPGGGEQLLGAVLGTAEDRGGLGACPFERLLDLGARRVGQLRGLVARLLEQPGRACLGLAELLRDLALRVRAQLPYLVPRGGQGLGHFLRAVLIEQSRAHRGKGVDDDEPDTFGPPFRGQVRKEIDVAGFCQPHQIGHDLHPARTGHAVVVAIGMAPGP